MYISGRLRRRLGIVFTITALATLGAAGIASASPASNIFTCRIDSEGDTATCTVTTTALHERDEPTSNSGSEGVLPAGTTVFIDCWTTGQSVDGDNIWYQGQPLPVNQEIVGFFMAGEFLATGHDPSSAWPNCGDQG